MARGNTDQHFAVTLSVPDAHGNEVMTDGPIVWASSDETVVMARNLSTDGKSGELKLVHTSQKDAGGNEIAVRVTFTADADLGTGMKTLTAVTEDIFVDLGPSSMGQSIVVTLGAAVDDSATP